MIVDIPEDVLRNILIFGKYVQESNSLIEVNLKMESDFNINYNKELKQKLESIKPETKFKELIKLRDIVYNNIKN